MEVLQISLKLEKYFKTTLHIKNDTLGKIKCTLLKHQDHYEFNDLLFHPEHHNNYKTILCNLIKFVDYQNSIFHFNNQIEKKSLDEDFRD